MKILFISKSLYLILFFLIVQQISWNALLKGHLISLYNSNDKITILSSENFSSIVYQSKTAWLIEFYASWCGHCQSYAKIYRDVAIDIWLWKTVVRIGAINCYAGDNHPFCRQFDIHGFPTLRLILPESIFNQSQLIPIPATEASGVEYELIKGLDNVHENYTSWPDFTPINRPSYDELYARVPSTVKFLLIIVEQQNDVIGRQLMLDFLKYRDQFVIFRTTTDGKLWPRFHINITDVPSLFIIFKNRTSEQINLMTNISNNFGNRHLFSYTIRLFINRTKLVDNFDDQDFEEIILSKNALKNADIEKIINKQNVTDTIVNITIIHRKVNMIDLELALSYMFQHEIPQMKQIQGETYHTLVQWVTVLTKYFPGRKPIMNYFNELLLKIKEKSNGFSGNTLLEMVDTKNLNFYLPNDYNHYQHCEGSSPKYRGYPCALWLLFHTLTVSQYHTESEQFNVTEVPLAIKHYIKYFFGCRRCSENFMKETNDINQLNSTNRREAIIYLWQIHNRVNKRLHGEITEDPKHPKLQFPSRYVCGTCQLVNTNEYDIIPTIDFLIQYYAKSNIETSLISMKSDYPEEYLFSNAIDQYQRHESIRTFEIFDTIEQNIFVLNILVIFIIIIGLFHRRNLRKRLKRFLL